MVLHAPPTAATTPVVTAETSHWRITRNLGTRRVRHALRTWLYVGTDLLAILTATVIAALISIYTWAPSIGVIADHFFSFRNLALTCAVSALWLGSVAFTRGYSHQSRTFPRIGRENAIKGSLVFASCLAMVDAVSTYSLFHHFGLIGLPIGLSLLILCRTIGRRITLRFRSDLRHTFLAIGQVRDINLLLQSFNAVDSAEKRIHGILLTDPENRADLHGETTIPVDEICMDVLSTEDFVHTAASYDCDAVWVASIGEFGHRNLRRLSWQLNKLNMRLYLDPMVEGISGTRLDVVPVGPHHALYVDRPRFSAANGLVKRLADVVLSIIALILTAPLMIITALAIKIEDGGPVFYISERIGYHGTSFRILKFRSMHIDADARLARLRASIGAQGLFKMKDDPRITKVGKFIRKTSIDELPQFFNSLLGTMSVVGPRPHLQHEVDAFSTDMRMRMEVRPGITGLWQVSGRSDLTPTQAEQLDLYYVDNWSLALDAWTIARTVHAVVLPRGAY